MSMGSKFTHREAQIKPGNSIKELFLVGIAGLYENMVYRLSKHNVFHNWDDSSCYVRMWVNQTCAVHFWCAPSVQSHDWYLGTSLNTSNFCSRQQTVPMYLFGKRDSERMKNRLNVSIFRDACKTLHAWKVGELSALVSVRTCYFMKQVGCKLNTTLWAKQIVPVRIQTLIRFFWNIYWPPCVGFTGAGKCLWRACFVFLVRSYQLGGTNVICQLD